MATLVIQLSGYIYPEDWFWDDDQNGISYDRVKRAIDAVGLENIDELVLQIDSGGGEMWEGWRIYDWIKATKIAVKTIVVGQACSMAVPLFLLGETRLLSPNSDLMIHLPMVSFFDANRIQIQALLDMALEEEKKVTEVFKAVTGASEADIKADLEAETWMRGQVAVDKKYATGLFEDIQQVTNKFNVPVNIKKITNLRQKPVFCSRKIRNSEGELIDVPAFDKRPDREKPTNPKPEGKPENKFSRIKSKLSMKMPNWLNKLLENQEKGVFKNADYTTTGGVEITIEHAGTETAEGDTVKKKDGTDLEDGTYELSNGQKITVAAGVITTVETTNAEDVEESTPPTNEDSDKTLTLEQATATLVNVRKERDDARKELATLKATNKRQEVIITSFTKLLEQTDSPAPETATDRTPKSATAPRMSQEEAEEAERKEMFLSRLVWNRGKPKDKWTEKEPVI